MMLDGLNDVLSEDSRTDPSSNSCLEREQFRGVSSTLPNRSVSTQNLPSVGNSPIRRSLSKAKVSWENRRSVEFLNTLHLKNENGSGSESFQKTSAYYNDELDSNTSQSGIKPSKSRLRPSGSNLNRSRSMTTGDLNFTHVSMVCIFGVQLDILFII